MTEVNIEVKTFYSGWRRVSETQARAFMAHLASHMSAVQDDGVRIGILRTRIRGITLEELAGCDSRDPTELRQALIRMDRGVME